MQVKMFETESYLSLEDEVNNFIEDLIVVDIKYKMVFMSDEYINPIIYSAMVMYRGRE